MIVEAQMFLGKCSDGISCINKCSDGISIYYIHPILIIKKYAL